MEISLRELTISKAHQLLIDQKIKVKDLVDVYLGEIKEKNKDINAYLEIYNNLDEQIEKAQELIDSGGATLLTGIPIAIKDNILYKGQIASASSLILENYVATYDSFVVERLKDEGVIFLGRTNMDEFAMGSSTETSAFGVTKILMIYLEYRRIIRGFCFCCSGDMALVALGTETCGSVRQPAFFVD
jgi:aspartyl-tRNA(Asn)/glutamyl-tRNA(Gln) amidotransferase subunit A